MTWFLEGVLTLTQHVIFVCFFFVSHIFLTTNFKIHKLESVISDFCTLIEYIRIITFSSNKINRGPSIYNFLTANTPSGPMLRTSVCSLPTISKIYHKNCINLHQYKISLPLSYHKFALYHINLPNLLINHIIIQLIYIILQFIYITLQFIYIISQLIHIISQNLWSIHK